MNGIDRVKIKNKEPTNKQLNFMFALLSEPTISEACKKAHISEKNSIYMVKKPIFSNAL